MPAQETAAAAQRIYWSAEAEERLNRIPRFVRPMVRQRIEAFARQKGYGEITPRVMDEAREIMGM
ncbi:MAG: protochlorophyllide oxidoreductase [Nitrospinota bacterium]|nr:MAG: protochlorophyllide oxidoreductase [Nitrospinota bacterium]